MGGGLFLQAITAAAAKQHSISSTLIGTNAYIYIVPSVFAPSTIFVTDVMIWVIFISGLPWATITRIFSVSVGVAVRVAVVVERAVWVGVGVVVERLVGVGLVVVVGVKLLLALGVGVGEAVGVKLLL